MSKKISGNISAIKTVLSGAGIKAQKGARTTKKMTSYLLELFSTIDDPRIHGMLHYPLDYILLISFLAVLGGAENWVEISDFGNGMKRWLGKFIPVKKYGIPAHDTFRRVFGLLDKNQLQERMTSVLSENLELMRKSLHIENVDAGYKLYCIDGKEENGTGRRYKSGFSGKVRNTQTLHIYDATNCICLCSEQIDKKTNEIPTARRLLEKMDLTDTICTFDALHMQRETVETIQKHGGHYVGGLKGNQQGLMGEAASCFTAEKRGELIKSARDKGTYMKTVERAHGQKETREFFIVPVPQNEERDKKWEGLRTFTMCVKTLEPDDPCVESSTETRYYASSLEDIVVISEAIRGHWGVEQFHWQLDATFNQDGNSTMDATAFGNLSLLNKMCLHVYQLMKMSEKNTSIKRLRKRFAWNFEESMEQLLAYFDDEAIKKTISKFKDTKN